MMFTLTLIPLAATPSPLTSSPLTPLAFGFFSPSLALAGLALAMIPILIHLLNRRRYRTVSWAAMDLLSRAIQKNRRRTRFENWLLLILRCLVLVLMGLALSRPIGCDAQSAASLGRRTGLHVLVIDNSCSMSYVSANGGGKTHLDQAKIIAGDIIDHLNPGAESVMIITAAKPAAGEIPKPTFDLQQARSVLNRIPQSYGAADLSTALRLAIDVGHQQESEPNKHLYLLTDGTASAWQGPDAAALKTAGPELARLFQVSHSNLSTGPQWNQAVLDVAPSSNLITTNSQFSADFIANVKGFGEPHDGTLQWKMDGKLLTGDEKLHLDSNTKPQVESQTNLEEAMKTGGPHAMTATLLNDDGLQADNSRTRVFNVVSQLKTLIVEGHHGAGVNLKGALAGIGKSGRNDGFAAPDLISDLELGNRVLADYQAVILCGISQFTPAEADQLHDFVSRGGTLMLFLADNILPDSYNDLLLPRHLIPGPLVKRVIPSDGKSFYFDFNPNAVLHPLLSAFAHQTDTGLETAQSFGYWQTDVPNDPQLRVLNWKSDGSNGVSDPAITQHRLGQGQVIFVTTSANEQWITFTRKPIYTELINELLSRSINVNDAWMNLTVGDRLVLPVSVKTTTPPAFSDPRSTPIPLESVAGSDGSSNYTSPPLTLPGVYTLTTDTAHFPVAVNVPAQASDVRTLDNAAIKSALGGIDLSMTDDQPVKVSASSTDKADWGWSLMLMVLGVIGAETLLAARSGHSRKGI